MGIAAQQPTGKLNALFEGPVFGVGRYVGAVLFPNYTTRGTTGFYLLPVFGAAADFLVLMAFWFVIIAVVRWFRAEELNNEELR